MKKLGILGLGHMGMAIAKGALRTMDPSEIMVTDHNQGKLEEAASCGITIAADTAELCQNAHMVVVAVRPQNLSDTLEELKAHVPECLLSVVAGAPIRRFTDALGNIPVIRTMPNTPLQLFEGATALCHNDICPQEDFAWAMNLFQTMGEAAEISEDHMCDVIAVNGSTPAYFYYLVECLLNDAVERGMSETDARRLLVQTMIGSGCLLRQNPDKPVSTFVDEVCSKGGTTIEAITHLKENGFETLIKEADAACIKRAEELGKQY